MSLFLHAIKKKKNLSLIVSLDPSQSSLLLSVTLSVVLVCLHPSFFFILFSFAFSLFFFSHRFLLFPVLFPSLSSTVMSLVFPHLLSLTDLLTRSVCLRICLACGLEIACGQIVYPQVEILRMSPFVLDEFHTQFERERER